MIVALVVTAAPPTDAAATGNLEDILEILVADSSRFGAFYPCPTLGGRVCDYPDAVAISVVDLDTGESASVNGDILMRMASAAKPVWMAAGIHDLGISAIEPYAAPIFVESSNYDAAAVIDLIGPLCHNGVDRLNTIVATEFGRADLALNSWYGCRAALLTRPPWGSNRISTNGLAAFWAELARGELLDPDATATLLAWGSLERNHWPDLISARQPPGTTMSYKAGWMSLSEGSRIVGGVITTPLGRRFAISIALRAYSGSYTTGAREWSAYASCVVAHAVMGVAHDCVVAGDPPLTPIDTGSLDVAESAPVCPPQATCDTVMFVDGASRWYLYSGLGAGSTINAFYYGVPGDIAFTGDWDCNGTTTPGLYRQSDGFVYLGNSFGVPDITYYFGVAGDIPIAGDFDNDGCDTLGIYRPSEGRVYISNTLGTNGGFFVADYSYYFGLPGDKPFVGDFNGDGIDTIGLHRQTTGFVYFRNTHSSGIADSSFFYGIPGDRILAADWDGDGDDTVAVYRPSTRRFYINLSNTQSPANYTIYVGTYTHVAEG